MLELSGGETDPMMMSCMVPDATIVAQSPVAFRRTVDSIIGGIAFEPGEPYLVSAYDGVVSDCGLSGPATPELQQLYDQAFPG